MLRRLRFCLMLIAAGCGVHSLGSTTAQAQAWRQEQWTVAPFTAALGGGPDWGPVEEVGSSLWAMAPDPWGNLYLLVDRDADSDGQQFIDIVTPRGMRYHLAGTGRLGYRDGPAHQAEFRCGVGAYYGFANLSADDAGNIYVADSGNGCVRRIYKDQDGKWTVQTYAGAGDRKLAAGETCGVEEAALIGTMMVAAAPDGRLTIATTYQCFQVPAGGGTIACLGAWPASFADPNGHSKLNGCGGDSDRQGNAYFVGRSPDVVVKVTPKGEMSHIAGILTNGRKPHEIGDRAPREAYFDTPSSAYCSPDGTCVYACGGDEYDIRRVPTDGKTTTATLLKNGRWYVMPEHPNRNRGRAEFDPSLVGKSKVEGGPLTNLVVAPLVGRDAEGNLYGKINRWTARTQDVAGEGLLGTRVFIIRRAKEQE